MGINKRMYYDMYCDGCGRSLADDSECSFEDTDCLRDVAIESDWHEIDDKWYCPDCCHIDDETDEYVPNKVDIKV